MRRTSFSFHCTRYCSNITVLARSIDTNHFGTYLILNFIMAIYICVTRPLLQQRRHPRRHVRQLPSTIYFSTILFRNGKVDTDSLYLHQLSTAIDLIENNKNNQSDQHYFVYWGRQKGMAHLEWRGKTHHRARKAQLDNKKKTTFLRAQQKINLEEEISIFVVVVDSKWSTFVEGGEYVCINVIIVDLQLVRARKVRRDEEKQLQDKQDCKLLGARCHAHSGTTIHNICFI